VIKLCPLMTQNPKKPVACQEHACTFYIQLQGQHPQTGEMLNEWGCAVAWMPILQIEASQQARQAGASVDKLTNEVVREGERTRNLFTGMAEQARLERDGTTPKE
jgi:hypothetical protein